MNIYEFEGKQVLQKHGITIPKGIVVRRGDDVASLYKALGALQVVVKAQVLSGKRGKNNGIVFCSTADEVVRVCDQLFTTTIRGQYVASVLIEEKIAIAREEYVSIVYDTTSQQPLLLYSAEGGMDIEEVPTEKIVRAPLDVRMPELKSSLLPESDVFQKIWNCFLAEDARQIEINPLVVTTDGRYVAADAKIALDDDAFYRHEEWGQLEPRTMMGRLPTEREIQVKKIDEGEGYYRGTAGKYIEMDGDIAILFSGGGASIANMDALIKAGLKPANYTEYSGNPPREKVRELAKIVLSKPGLRGLWIAGGVANFTNIAETFHGIVDALDEIKPKYPIVIRRAGPFEEEGMQLMKSCAERNGLVMHFFGKETSMSDTAGILARLIV
jgi:citryl-CoA synthetase large subunit